MEELPENEDLQNKQHRENHESFHSHKYINIISAAASGVIFLVYLVPSINITAIRNVNFTSDTLPADYADCRLIESSQHPLPKIQSELSVEHRTT